MTDDRRESVAAHLHQIANFIQPGAAHKWLRWKQIHEKNAQFFWN